MSYDDLSRGRRSIPAQIYSITTVTRDRQPLFRNFTLARSLSIEMRQLHDVGEIASLAWVIMPDHLHWLFQLTGTSSLPLVMKGLKGRSARRIGACLGQQGGIWQRACYDRAIRSEEDIREIAGYIVANPVRAGLVKQVGDYPHWDCAWL